MRFCVFFLLAFSFVFFSSFAFAAVDCRGFYASKDAAKSACQSVSPNGFCGGGATWDSCGYPSNDYQSVGYWTGLSGGSDLTGYFYNPYDEGCPSGTQEDPVTHECKEPDPCIDAQGELIDMRGPGRDVPITVCKSSRKAGAKCQFGIANGISAVMDGDDYVGWVSTFVNDGVKCDAETSENLFNTKPGQDWQFDFRKTISSTDELPPNSVCTSNGDGTQSCVSVKTTTVTETLGQGDVITGKSTSTSVTHFEGNTKTTTNEVTTTDDGHGNISTVTNNMVNVTTGGTSTSAVGAGGGITSGETQGGITHTSNETITETVDSSGHKTISSSVSGTAGGAGGAGGADGTGSGSGGTGQGDCIGTDCGDDEAPSFSGLGPGDLYTPTDKTYSSVISSFQSRLQNAAFYQSATDFFTVSLAGSCPVWTIPSVMGMPAIAIDMQCSSTMESIWPYISAIMIATAGFVGFRWALL